MNICAISESREDLIPIGKKIFQVFYRRSGKMEYYCHLIKTTEAACDIIFHSTLTQVEISKEDFPDTLKSLLNHISNREGRNRFKYQKKNLEDLRKVYNCLSKLQPVKLSILH
jgi:hypothetical protein